MTSSRRSPLGRATARAARAIDRLTSELDLTSLCDAARAVRAAGPDPGIVTFSPKVFVPLTFACRADGYCTFAKDPEAGGKIYMSVEQVIDVAERGRVAGATSACSPSATDRRLCTQPRGPGLNDMGFESTATTWRTARAPCWRERACYRTATRGC